MSQIPSLQWIRQQPTFNSVASNGGPTATNIDSQGYIYVTYGTSGAVSGQTHVGNSDIVVMKMDSLGNVIWLRQNAIFDTGDFDQFPISCLDHQDNLCVMYTTGGTVSGQTLMGGTDIVVMKMSTFDGAVLWIKQQPIFNTTGTDINNGYGITVDQSNNLYVTYMTNGTVSGQTLTGGLDIVFFKMDSNGNVLWIRQQPTFNTLDAEYSGSIAVGSTGHIYLCYSTFGTTSGQTNVGQDDIVVASFDATGNMLWIRQQTIFNTAVRDYNVYMRITSDDYLYITYNTQGTTSGGTNVGGLDLVVMKMDSSGNVVWIRQNAIFNTVGDENGATLAIDSLNQPYITYRTAGTVSGQTNTGSGDIVIMKMDVDGNVKWVLQQPTFNTAGNETLPYICLDVTGNLYLTYTTTGTTSGQTLTGAFDIVVAKFLVAQEFQPTITIDASNYLYLAYFSNITIHPATGGNDIIIVKKKTNGDTVWVKQNAVLNATNDNRNPVIVSKGTSLYLVYQTTGVISGGVALFPDDLVVAKLDTDGNLLWIQQQPTFNTTRSDEAPTLDVDSSENIYIAYQTTGKVSGGYRMGFKDRTDLVVFKMNSNGQVIWTRQSKTFNTLWGSTSANLKCDNHAQVLYVAYTCAGRIVNQNFSGYTDITLMKMNFAGQILSTTTGLPWVLQQPTFNTTLADDHSVICVDQVGYLYLCFVTNGGAVSGFTNVGLSDLVICKIKSTGQVVKVVQNAIFDTTADDISPSMVYHNGFLYVAYQTEGKVSGQTHVGAWDIVVMKINAVTLSVVWIRQSALIDTPYDEIQPALTVDPNGNCYVTYVTQGNLNNLTIAGQSTVVICRFNNDGTFVWLRRGGT
jgi:hypothetical protein